MTFDESGYTTCETCGRAKWRRWCNDESDKPMRALVVEDSDEDACTLKRLLAEIDVQADVAASLDAMPDNLAVYDFIILDLLIPDADPDYVIQFARELSMSKMVAFVLTGYQDLAVAEKAGEAGIGYWLKMDKDTLRIALAYLRGAAKRNQKRKEMCRALLNTNILQAV